MGRIHIEKQELKKAELWRDEDTGQYFFRLEYLCENDAEVYRLIFPKVETGIPLMQPYTAYDYSMFPGICITKIAFHLCDGEDHIAYPDKNGNRLYWETVSVKTHEMTMEEIEKKLGYKIKIISKKEEERK